MKIKYGLWIRIHFSNSKYLNVKEKNKIIKADKILKYIEKSYDKFEGIKEVIVVFEPYESDFEKLKNISKIVQYSFWKKDNGNWNLTIVK